MTRWLRLRMWLGRNLLTLLGVLVGVGFALLFLAPLMLTMAQSLKLLSPSRLRRGFELLEIAHWRSIQAIICAWIFALGSSIASFLNVVAYRLPHGRSILGRSSCPRCCQQLSAWDNVPIFGWLRNGGRCRTCRLPISVRYLLVELILGSVFLLVFLADVGTIRTIQGLQLSQPDLVTTAIVSLILFFGHALLLSLLFTAALIQSERFPIPRSLVVTGWALGGVWFCVFQIGFVYWQSIGSIVQAPTGLSIFFAVDWLSTGASLLAAFVLGALLPLDMHGNPLANSQGFDIRETAAFGWIGMFLNLPTILATGVFAAALILLARCTRSRWDQPFACVFLAVIIALMCEHGPGFWWIRSSGRLLSIASISMVALTIGLSLIARKFGTVKPREDPD